MFIFKADKHADEENIQSKARQRDSQLPKGGNGEEPRCSQLKCDCGLEAYTGGS